MVYAVSFDVLDLNSQIKRSETRKNLTRRDITALTNGYASILEATFGRKVEAVYEKGNNEYITFLVKREGKEVMVGGISVEKM